MNKIDKYISKKLRVIRLEKGLSQQNLGELVGLTFQQIQKYELGKNRIACGRLYEFSKIFNVPVSYFFEDFDVVEKINCDIIDCNVIKLVNSFNKIKNDNNKTIILDIMKLVTKMK